MKMILLLLLVTLSYSFCNSQSAEIIGGWKLTNYTFVDGTSNEEKVLAGTSSKMNDVDKFKGSKGDIEISKNRWDQKTGALLAGVTYAVKWTDPPAQILTGDKIRMHFELKVITSKSWTPDPISVSFNQGMGIYLLNTKGDNYFKSDFNGDLISAKAVAKGSKNNEEKTIIVNMGAGFKAIYSYVYDANLQKGQAPEPVIEEPKIGNITGWYLTNYTFVDGSSNTETVLAGTNSKMNDVAKFKGSKGNIEISKNRWDKKTGGLLAGVTYTIKWSDPPTVLLAGDKIRMNFELKTITSKSWTPDPISVNFNQGIYGLYLINPQGENYFKKDFSAEVVTGKTVLKGNRANETKVVTANFGAGFKAIYTYEWREF